jgi:hypothetical protein
MGKKLWPALALLVLFPAAAMSMGGLGGGVPSSIPTPARAFNFTVTDQQGTTTRLREFSIDGLVYLSGRRGLGTIAIPFERIKQVELRLLGDKLRAEILMVDGQTTELVMEGRQTCYGRMEYANYQIDLRDLEKLVNDGQASQ